MLYELLDDGYSSSRWMANTETGNRAVTPADDNYNVRNHHEQNSSNTFVSPVFPGNDIYIFFC